MAVKLAFLLFCLWTSAKAEFPMDSSEEEDLRKAAVEKGKTQWDLLQSKSKMPKYGTCWQKALGQVEAGCKRLDEDQQARLSLALVACQMDQLGIRRKPASAGDGTAKEEENDTTKTSSYHCPPDAPLKTCTRGLDEDINAFTAFSQFFTHTAHICYFLESQRWRETTKMTVEALLRSSDVVARGLNVSTQLQAKLISSQEELLTRGANLSKSLESSSAGVQRLFEEFRASTENQRLMIRDTIAQVVELRSFIVDQVGLFYSYVFYVAALIVATLITSTKRTSGARIWLYVVMTMNLVAERLFLYYVDNELVHLYSAHEISDLVVVWAWRCRQTAMIIGGLTLLWKIFSYQDPHLVNFSMLKEIQSQNADLKTRLDQLSSTSGKSVSSPAKRNVVDVSRRDERDGKENEAEVSTFLHRSSSTLKKSDETYRSHQDSIFSKLGPRSDSSRSTIFPAKNSSSLDATFVPNRRPSLRVDEFSDNSRSEDDDTEDSGSSSSSSSGRSSRTEVLATRSSTPCEGSAAFPARTASSSSSFLSASFAAAGSSFASSASAMASSVGSKLTGLLEELRSLSPPGIKTAPLYDSDGSPSDEVYHLRPRRRSALFSAPSKAPSSLVGVALRRGVDVLQEETPEEFGAEVKRMWNVSRRNAQKVKRAVNASSRNMNGLGCFSSDDE